MSYVVDASVAVKWYVAEDGHDAAMVLLDSDEVLSAPDLVMLEVGNVLAKKARRGEIERRPLQTSLQSLATSLDHIETSTPWVTRAVELSFELNHALYDCIYLALAESQAATLVTADQKFLEKCRDSAFAGLVLRLDQAADRISEATKPLSPQDNRNPNDRPSQDD